MALSPTSWVSCTTQRAMSTATSPLVFAMVGILAVVAAMWAPVLASASPHAYLAAGGNEKMAAAVARQLWGVCPEYEAIAQPSVKDLDVERYQGIWYEVAIHDNGQPGFCDCSVLNWTLDAGGKTFTDVYEGRCFGRPFHLPLHGRPGNSTEPGFYHEGITQGTAVPNMVFNISTTPAGEYDFAMVLSCLGGWPLGQAFQLLSRQPHVPIAQIDALLKSAATVVGEALISQVKPINMTDHCGF